MGTKKSTKIEMKVREGEILKYIADGYGRQEISEKIAFVYKCSKLAVCKQYDRLVKDMQVITPEERETHRAIILHRYEDLYKTARGKNQLKTGGEILDKQAKLLGLYEKGQAAAVAPKITISPKKKLAVVGDDGNSE